MKIGYLGPQGTFTEQAARRAFEKFKHAFDLRTLRPYRSIPELLCDVDRGSLPMGVVPIENSIEGSVVVTLDWLIHEVNLSIVGEIVLPISHHLMVNPGVTVDEIEVVVSHPQGLAQCRKSLEKMVPRAAQLAATSTAEAARQITSKRRYAAIGTALAAELYGLVVLKSDMQDVQGNATRFVAVSKRSAERTGFDKTSIAFAFEKDQPGNLYGALESFARRNINLTKLESRPAKKSLGDYLFLADMEGHTDDVIIEEALDEVRSACSFFKVLGSFPRVHYTGVAPDATRRSS